MRPALAGAATAAAAAALISWWRRKAEQSDELPPPAASDDVPPPAEPQPALSADAAQLKQLLAVIENGVLPQTAKSVAGGNKVFGAAILDQSLRIITVGTNLETACPINHGEIRAIQCWSELPRKPPSADCVFLATHEPCCLCVSAVVWSGFTKCFYLYPYETTKAQGIPHDLNIMHELWRVPRYVPRNRFCATGGILPLIDALPEGPEKRELLETVVRITALYDTLAHRYHSEKASNPNNDMAFN